MRPRWWVGLGVLVVVVVSAVGLMLPEPDGNHENKGHPSRYHSWEFDSRSDDRTAQSNLRNATAVANVLYADWQDYTQPRDKDFEQAEPSLDFRADPGNPRQNTPRPEINYLVTSPTRIVLGIVSDTGACFYAQDNKSMSGVNRGSKFMGTGQCVALDELTVEDPRWNDEF